MERRFFCSDIPAIGESVTLSSEESHHIQSVLRGRVGESLLLMNGKGMIASATIIEAGGRRRPVICCVDDCTEFNDRPNRLHLYVAPTRGKGMVGIVRSATELGVSSITPILCERATSRPETSASGAWLAAAVSGIKQSINPFCPEIQSPIALSEVVMQDITPGVIGWVPETACDPTVDITLGADVSLFIGPEGGFTAAEAEMIQQKGIHPVTFGPYVLRVETAVVAGLSWLNSFICQGDR